MPDLTTFGCILVKFNTRDEKGREQELRNFILLLQQFTQLDLDKRKENPCDCPFQKEYRPCNQIKIESCASLTGFYDFILILRTNDIEALENFVIDCLKNGYKKDLIVDSHTLAGTFIKEFRANIPAKKG